MSAVTGHMAETTAGVAGLLATPIATSTKATSITATLRAVPSNVTNSTTLVALLAASGPVVFTSLGTFARDMTDTAATIAGFLLGGYSAFAA